MRITLFHRKSSCESDAPLDAPHGEAIRRAAGVAIALLPGNLQTVFITRASRALACQQFVELRADLYQAIAVTRCEHDARLALALMSVLLDRSPPQESPWSWKAMLETLIKRAGKGAASDAASLRTVALSNVQPIA